MGALEIKNTARCLIKESSFEPVKIGEQVYGKDILFDNQKKRIIFSSNFHGPGKLSYEKFSGLEIKEMNKRKLFTIAGILCFFIIGVPLIFALIHLPRWQVKLILKKPIGKKNYILIRAHMDYYEPDFLKDFLKNDFETEIMKLER